MNQIIIEENQDSAQLKMAWNVKLSLLIIAILLAVASCIKSPFWGSDLLLQHLGTLILLLPLMLELKKQKLSISACVCLFLFICIHILGARYIYSNVPYNQWAKILLNLNIKKGEIHGNMYDRFVHLAFGVLFFPLVFQMARRILNTEKIFPAILFAWLSIQTLSMAYEIFEWLLTVFLSPEDADSYNGQQGDMWDAQKDMALALVGSTLSAIWIYLIERRQMKQTSTQK